MNEVLVSVVLPIFNGEKFLTESINSILNQSFKKFELIVINDGSTDNSYEYIKKFKDTRLLILNNDKNIGLSNSLNKGILVAKGKYIARMDQDDISHINRLKIQFNFMEKNKNIGLCGSNIEYIGDIKKIATNLYCKSSEIKSNFLFQNSIIHPTVFIKRELILKHNLFYNNIKDAEDYDLWSRCIDILEFANIKKILLYYREHNLKTSVKTNYDQVNNSNNIRNTLLKRFNKNIKQEECILHNRISNYDYIINLEFLNKSYVWLKKLISLNEKIELFDKQVFKKVINDRWYFLFKNEVKDIWTLNYFLKNQINSNIFSSIIKKNRLRIKYYLNR